MLSRRVLFFAVLLLVSFVMSQCNAYKTSNATVPTKEVKRKEAANKKALKRHLKKQEAKKRKVEELEYLDRTPTPGDKQKKGTPKSPETFY